MTAEDLKEDLVLVWGFQREEPCFEIFRKQLDIVLEAYHQSRVNAISEKDIVEESLSNSKRYLHDVRYAAKDAHYEGAKWFKQQLLK
tara:strand:- start:7731 stop:7991 length:261 start_codon:yes stop_codon:yes gene_type:complete